MQLGRAALRHISGENFLYSVKAPAPPSQPDAPSLRAALGRRPRRERRGVGVQHGSTAASTDSGGCRGAASDA